MKINFYPLPPLLLPPEELPLDDEPEDLEPPEDLTLPEDLDELREDDLLTEPEDLVLPPDLMVDDLEDRLVAGLVTLLDLDVEEELLLIVEELDLTLLEFELLDSLDEFDNLRVE